MMPRVDHDDVLSRVLPPGLLLDILRTHDDEQRALIGELTDIIAAMKQALESQSVVRFTPQMRALLMRLRLYDQTTR